MQSIDTDIASAGGGYGGGWGGFGNNPLLWLITLGFLGGRRGFGLDDNGGGGVAATASVENGAKIDCLQQGQAALQSQLQSQTAIGQFDRVNTQLNTLGLAFQGINDTIFRENSATQRQLATCCCDLKTAVQGVETAVALQTKDLVMNSNANTQAILDKLCDNQVTALQTDNANLRTALQTAEIKAACHPH